MFFDVLGILLILLCPITLICLLSPNTSGAIGDVVSDILVKLIGAGAYIMPFLLLLFGAMIVVGPLQMIRRNIGIGSSAIFFTIITWASLSKPDAIDNSGGGIIGNLLANGLKAATGETIGFIVLVAVFIISVIVIIDIPLVHIIDKIREAYLYRKEIAESRYIDKKGTSLKDKSAVESSKQRTMSRIFGKDGGVQPTEIVLPPLAKSQIKISGVDKPNKGTKYLDMPLNIEPLADESDFQLPPTTLLNEPEPPPMRMEDEIHSNIEIIERTLDEFKVTANVVEIACGPTVARYEIQLAAGIRVNKIINLADNLAMQLAAIDVRIEAPIPGKAAIGVEVPNKNRATVGLREVLENTAFRDSESRLTFALGKDVSGLPVTADLVRMPHLLIGGATNSGKSIGLNALICSLLFKNTPDELKLILVDPKRVELTLYEGIPHLACPVIKDVHKAAGILKQVVTEMEKRYEKFGILHVKNIDGYNEKADRTEKLPYIVVVIDELCDLMMQCGAEIEGLITRIAQLARATGIHLVIATQRPSVDVITGLMKANIPSRIAFAVSSYIDSRTILDQKGGERLIGRGDMLYLPIDANKPKRIQGCYVNEREIDRLCEFLKAQRKPNYIMDAAAFIPSGKGSNDVDEAMSDEYYELAVRFVVAKGECSTSSIQRKYKIGYTRAARLVDYMYERGIVGEPNGAKPRDVLVNRMDLDNIFGKQMSIQMGNDENNEYSNDAQDFEDEE